MAKYLILATNIFESKKKKTSEKRNDNKNIGFYSLDQPRSKDPSKERKATVSNIRETFGFQPQLLIDITLSSLFGSRLYTGFFGFVSSNK